jgi:4-hydroxythreonine-4-phosphate dehydrogenase
MSARPIIGLTMGDPAGIGPELCLRALREPSVLAECMPVVFGDEGLARRILSVSSSSSLSLNRPAATKATCKDVPYQVVSLAEWEKLGTATESLLVDCAAVDAPAVAPGKVSAACGRAGYAYIERAIQSALAKKIDAVVTAPIHKEALRLAGVSHPGHTEIFTALTGARRSCMMLRSEVLTVSLATTHLGYAEVPRELSVPRVLDVIELTAETLQWMLGRSPRLGVCGLNPHAGEHGLFGHAEEEKVVAPAVAQAKAKGILVEGPLAPDAAFTTAQRKKYDGIICLYHDQGHIPFKMLAFDTGVNITLGLPIIRTSVDHGTAFDIAWQGVANPQSLFAAIHAAVALARGRKTAGAPA